MSDDPKPLQVIPGHVGYSPDYDGRVPIDVPSIMRAGWFDEGVKAERARIVAWLRKVSLDGPPSPFYADAIERGEHVAK